MSFDKSELSALTIHEAAVKLRAREVSSEELTRASFERIDAVEGELHSFVTLTRDAALESARAADARGYASADISPLAGVPAAIKDVLTTRGVTTTASSNILKNYVPPYDATVVSRLKRAGMVMVGKTNCDAFAHGSSTENSDFGPSHNPWDVSRVPGGSSGGSASAVAGGEAVYSLGTDTGGSVRQPAAFCGLVGLKPTYGRSSRRGLMAMASSTDCVGTFTKDVHDAALVLGAIAGSDPKDATTSPHAVPDYVADLKRASLKGKRIGLPREFFNQPGVQPEAEAAVRTAIAEMERAGAQVQEISLPHTQYGIPVYYILCSSEVSSNLARFDGIRYGHSVARDAKSDARSLLEVYERSRSEGFGDEAKRRIMIGTHVLSSGYYDAYYLKAAKVRTLLIEDFKRAFEQVDIIATPTSPHVAFKLGEKDKNPLEMYLEDVFVTTVSLAGLPAVSVPCGFADGLPLGLQLIGNYFGESQLLQAASVYEQATEWHTRWPK